LCKKKSDLSFFFKDENLFFVFREHVYEYMKFLRQVLQEADQLDNYAAHLCATARNMLELFHIIYPNLHEKKVQDFPYLTGNFK